MKKQMLINAVHLEQKRMAIVEDGKLVEFNIQMAVKEPITGNIYKGVVMKVERGLQAAFVNYGGKKDGFLPLRDVSPQYFAETNGREGSRPTLKPGQEILVQILREVSERKGALLTAYISLPGRYLVLLPNKESSGISRKIEDEEDRKRLKELVEQITTEEGLGFIVRTAGMNRTKQELARDYQHLSRLWKEIQKQAAETNGARPDLPGERLRRPVAAGLLHDGHRGDPRRRRGDLPADAGLLQGRRPPERQDDQAGQGEDPHLRQVPAGGSDPRHLPGPRGAEIRRLPDHQPHRGDDHHRRQLGAGLQQAERRGDRLSRRTWRRRRRSPASSGCATSGG